VVTRRALLGAGALALLAGCGPPEAAVVDKSAVLDEQLRLTQAAVAAYGDAAGDLKTSAMVRARELREAGARAEPTPAGPTGLAAALAAESAALRGHVAAVGQLADREDRELLARLVSGAATNESALLERLDRPAIPTAFPGEPQR